jgi:ATP-dependent DNA helicase RecQ
MKIKEFIATLRSVDDTDFPVVALTATATKKVRDDIVDRIGLVKTQEFVRGFDRKNIALLVRDLPTKDEKNEKLLEILDSTK